MDTSATVRKAIPEADKEEYRKKGRCFECGKQGHLARLCPDKKTRARTTTTSSSASISDTSSVFSEPKSQASDWTSSSLADYVRKMTVEERDDFVEHLTGGKVEEEEDFRSA
jgi:hypothetical protein